MKKWIYLLGMMTCFLSCTISVCAAVRSDVIVFPQDDFLNKHRDDCKIVNWQFIADGPDGVVILYKSPESDEEVAIWENGYQTWIVCTYEDERGIVWGIPSSEREEKIGWVPMEYMKFVYDSTSFTEDHSSQIERRDGRLDYESYKNDIIYLWKYPGSDNGISVNMQDLLDIFSHLDDYLNHIIPEYSFVYTDEEGRSWGYVGDYFKIYEDRWICLDNPTAEFEELYPNGAPQYGVEDDEEIKEGETQSEETQAAENLNTERIKPQTNQRIIVVVIVLVTAVVLVTILLLVRLKKRK